MEKKRILVAPLNWGLGHACRCIPIIRNLEKQGFLPVLASDGEALQLLKKEFPLLPAVELPSYKIKYSEKGKFLKLKLLMQAPHILKTIHRENIKTKELVDEYQIKGIISDNRWGAYFPGIKNVFITHQLKVLSGFTTGLTTKHHQKLMANFDEIWVPDIACEDNLSGILGHSKNPLNVKYIGPLSRFQKTDEKKYEYDYCVILSGPEPQRSLLEKILIKEFQKTSKKIIFVRGVFNFNKIKDINQIHFENFLDAAKLENVINKSELIIARSGYTTLMDLAKLEKKAFFIPTPGQDEQLYLAKRMKEKKIAPFCFQEDFSVAGLNEVSLFKGFRSTYSFTDFIGLFALFQSE